MAQRIQLRRDTATNWTATDPILASGEVGFETNSYRFKIGDGTSLWSDLEYFGAGGGGGGSGTVVEVVTYSAGWPTRPTADIVIWVTNDRTAAAPGGALPDDDIVLLPEPYTVLEYALSDEATAITTGTAKLTTRAPFAFTLAAVRASLTVVSSSGIPTVDINENGTTVLSTKLTIDASEKTSTTAATAAVISDAAIADDAELTFDIDVAGTGAKGLKVRLYVIPA